MGEELKDIVKETADTKVKYDHYSAKVDEMKTEAQCLRAKGKSASSGDIEKLKSAEESYDEVRLSVMGRLDSEVIGAKDIINRHMKRVLQFTQAFYTKAYQAVGPPLEEPLGHIDKLIKSPPKRTKLPEYSGGVGRKKGSGSGSDSDDPESPVHKKKNRTKDKKTKDKGSDSSDEEKEEEKSKAKGKKGKKEKPKPKVIADDSDSDSDEDFGSKPAGQPAGQMVIA